MNRRPLSDRRRFVVGPLRLCKIGIRVTAQELERIRIAAAKEGLRAGSWASKVVIDAALKVA